MKHRKVRSRPPIYGKLRSIAAYGLGPVLGLLSGPILARALGPDGRGQFAAIMQPISVAAAIAAIGVPTAVTFYISRGHNPRAIFRAGLRIVAPFAVMTYLVMAIYSVSVAEKQGLDRTLLLTAWSAIIISVVVQLARSYWQGQASWARLDRERSAFAISRFLAVCAVAVAGVSVAGPYVYASLGAFVLSALLLRMPRNAGMQGSPPPARREFLRYSTAASVGTISVVASNRLDQVLMPGLTGSRELGFYAIAVTIAEVPVIFGTLAARNALHSASAGIDMRSTLRDVRLYIVTGVACCFGALIVAPTVVPIVFGSDFMGSVSAVQILAISTMFSIFTTTAVAYIAGIGHPMISSLLPLASVLVTATGFLIYYDSVTSAVAAWISLASQVLAFAAAVCVVWRLNVRKLTVT